MVSRTGYTGELGYEVFCHPRDAAAVWDAIWEAGKAHDLTPLGLEALDMLRVEAGLIFAGYEFSDQTDPFEAGIGFTVPLKTKQDDFIGKAALMKRKENPQRVLVGLELTGDEMAANGDCVDIGRNQVGEITSAVRSPILRKNLALARIQVEHSALGTEARSRQARRPAETPAGNGGCLPVLRSDQVARARRSCTRIACPHRPFEYFEQQLNNRRIQAW